MEKLLEEYINNIKLVCIVSRVKVKIYFVYLFEMLCLQDIIFNELSSKRVI